MGLMDLFFEQGEEVPVQTPEVAVQTPQLNTQVASSIATIETKPNENSTTISGSNKFIEFFLKFLDESNLKGADYYEFKKNIEATEALNLGVTEDVKYKMVYTQLQTSFQINKKVITDAANTYLSLLEGKHSESLSEFESKKQKEIGLREQELAEIDKANVGKVTEIDRLTNEISQNNARTMALKQEINTESFKIDQKFNDFEFGYNTVCNIIKKDLEKIELYIK